MFLTLFIFSANNRRFLKPVINGRGLRPEGYVHYEDEDAYKSKTKLCHVMPLSPFNINFSCLMFVPSEMEWYITEMGKKRQKASLDRMLEMDSSDDDDDDDESSITSKFSQAAQANEEEYKPTEGIDVQPTEGDVVLSFTNEQYKNTMFRKFDVLGPKETPANQGVENEAVQQIFDNFKTEMKSGGRFLLMGSNYRSKHKKYRVADDKEARKSKCYLCLLSNVNRMFFL